MSFCEKIFEKELNQITFDDLKSFFEIEREESSKIEFKSGQIIIEDIYREICAFLNTDGGILIIGTPQEQKVQINKSNYKKVCKGELVPSNFRNKGWLTQKIAANISPFPMNIEIQEILTPSGNYFILEIPQSMSPPHQCTNEGKYYIRLEDEAKPAPHGIVQALFLKRQVPQISTESQLTTYKDKPENEIEINIEIKNVSNIPAENVSYLIKVENIEEIKVEEDHENSRNYRRKFEYTFTLQGSLPQVLVNGIHLPIDFIIVHKYEPFLLSLFVWGKDFGLYEDCCIWDPIDFKIIEHFRTGDSKNITRDDLIKKLVEILEKEQTNN